MKHAQSHHLCMIIFLHYLLQSERAVMRLRASVSLDLSYLAVVQQVQLPVDPLLDVQPPLEVFAVVFDRQFAQFALGRLLLFGLKHHSGLGAWLRRHACHNLTPAGRRPRDSSLSLSLSVCLTDSNTGSFSRRLAVVCSSVCVSILHCVSDS